MGDLKYPKPKKREKIKHVKKHKRLTLSKVQEIFNRAIRNRDERSVLSWQREDLQASHFIARGGSGALRYYPPNVHSMTAGEHYTFHNLDPLPYTEWMQANIPELAWMKRARKVSITWNQCDLEKIVSCCTMGAWRELTMYIENRINAKIGRGEDGNETDL